MKLLMEQWKKFINEEKTEERPSPEAIQSKVPFFLENPEIWKGRQGVSAIADEIWSASQGNKMTDFYEEGYSGWVDKDFETLYNLVQEGLFHKHVGENLLNPDGLSDWFIEKPERFDLFKDTNQAYMGTYAKYQPDMGTQVIALLIKRIGDLTAQKMAVK